MTSRHPFRFAVAAGEIHSRVKWQTWARRVEELGYSSLLVADHFLTGLSPAVALLSAAEATRTLRVGSYVFDNDFRHPAILARDAATLDLLTQGRFDLGIGSGWHAGEYKQAGIAFDSPGIRVARLEESLHIIKRLFADEPVTFCGQHYTITNLNGLPKPVQRPHPPILLGGAGKRLLALAAREADIVGIHVKLEGGKNFTDMSEAALAQRVAWIREAGGERFPHLVLNLLILKVIITDRPYATIERCIHNEGWGEYAGGSDQANSLSGWSEMTAEQIVEMPYFFIGTVDQLVEKLQMLRERYGISYVTVFAEGLDAFAPVVARLAGS